MQRQLTLCITFFSICFSTFGQVGGRASHEFLNLPVSARAAALGGNLITVRDNDLNLAIVNPSLLNKSMDNTLMVTFLDYFAGVKAGYIGYAKDYENIATFSLGMQHINYGKFIRAEENGDITGEFTGGEYALQLGAGREFGEFFSTGANFKLIYSEMESLKAFALAIDFAGTYYNDETGLGVSVLARNGGRQLVAYDRGNPQPLPFELQLAVSKRLDHAPFRFSLAFENAQRLRMLAQDTATAMVNPITGEAERREGGFFPNVLRHTVVGVEVLPDKNFNIRFGYNLQRAMDLRVDSRPGLVGLSWGFGLKVKKFNISYARSSYHLAGGSNHFTITTNLTAFSRN
ncbi:MAG: type IX secretion system protein PorQ [Bacteroidetes bacterium]|nr:type IX secretion system protein PorQ [Bacteroidota bacterium]